jgi:MarR family transcriptional regulator, 2-MHQ and catechol-resistance regulon repressor
MKETGVMALEEELQLDQPFKDLRHEAVLNVIHTATFLATLGSALFRRHGLTVAQFNVLFALKYKLGAITQSALSRRLVVTRASMTSVLDKLEAKGLVQRKAVPDNRRIYHISLTPAGRTLINAIEPKYRDDLHAVMADLSDAEARTLIGLLERVRARSSTVRTRSAAT